MGQAEARTGSSLPCTFGVHRLHEVGDALRWSLELEPDIQATNHVVHFARTWNTAKEDQATDRAYRIGQEKDVYLYYPVVVARDFVTFDVKLDALLNWKCGLSTDMLNGTGEASLVDFGDLEVCPTAATHSGKSPSASTTLDQ